MTAENNYCSQWGSTSPAQRSQLYVLRDIIGQNWEKVIAESVFKYAGSVYKDIDKLQAIIEANGDTTKAFATYGKHWGELKDCTCPSMGKNNIGETAVKTESHDGIWPVLLNSSQVTGVDSNGNFIKDEASGWMSINCICLKSRSWW